MKTTNIAILVLILITVTVFVGSQFISRTIYESETIIKDTKNKIMVEERMKMTLLLDAISESILRNIEDRGLDVKEDEVVLQVIEESIAPYNNVLGKILLVRTSPDGRILYDGDNISLQTDEYFLGDRNLRDEILPQNKSIKIINEFRPNNPYSRDNTITVEELIRMEEESPELYAEIHPLIKYENITRVQAIIEQFENNLTSQGKNYEWRLSSGDTEILEWVIIPPGSLGLKGEPDSEWGIINKNHRWALIIRRDKEEIRKEYRDIIKINEQKVYITKVLYMSLILILILSIVVITYYISISENK